MRDYSIFGASIIGPYHSYKETENQDRWGFAVKDRNLFFAVADGAGSLKESGEGARLSVENSLLYMYHNYQKNKPSHDDISEFLRVAVSEVSQALKREERSKEMGCTLAIGMITEDLYAVAVMGDALAVLKEVGEPYTSVRPEQESEFHNVTKLLTSDSFSTEVRAGRAEDLEFFGLASDGMDLSSLDKGDVPTQGFWSKLREWSREEGFDMEKFLLFLDSREKIDDDTTLVIAVPTE